MLLTIRKAQEEDASAISRLVHENTDRVVANKYSVAQKEAWKNANQPEQIREQLIVREVFCGFYQTELAGVIGLRGAELLGLYVDYRHLGKGVGKQLLRHLEDHARSKGVKTIRLCATPAGRPFYERNGFVPLLPVEVIVNDVLFIEMEMSKELIV